MSKNDFFIGWAESPKVDRRFFTLSGLGLMMGTGGLAYALAAKQQPGGPGSWNMAEVREWHGIATASPYSMLRTTDLDGTERTVLLGCQSKCAVSARIGNLAGKSVIVRGSLIQRNQHAMIAVIDGPDWIEEDPAGTVGNLAFPEIQSLEAVSLRGEILDSKCWFGAMSPSEGKVHKSCASLCIRGGIPPAFYVKDIRDQKALMILTDKGQGFGHDILEYVADPVQISGKLQRQGDLLLLDTSVSDIRRI